MLEPRLHVKHLCKECTLLKKYLSGGSKMGEQRKKPEPEEDGAEGKDDGFPARDGCLMIFGGPAAYEFRHRQKLTCWEVYVPELAAPAFL
jgi:hypothetical protein